MARCSEHLLCKHKDPSLNLQLAYKKMGAVTIYNPALGQGRGQRAAGSQGLLPASQLQVQGLTLSQGKKAESDRAGNALSSSGLHM